MLKLYHCPNARSMRSLWLLYELNIEFELVEMPFDQKFTRSPEYLSVHPLGRVPCLVHNDLISTNLVLFANIYAKFLIKMIN